MKKGNVFWGVLLISAGACFLLFNFDIIDIQFKEVIAYWPVLLILFGLSMLKINEKIRTVLLGLSAAALGFLIIALFANIGAGVNKIENEFKRGFKDGVNDARYEDYQDYEYNDSYSAEFDSNYKEAVFDFKGGVSAFEINDVESEKLVKIQMNKQFGKFSAKSQDSAFYVLFITDSDTSELDFDDESDFDRYAIASFNPEIIWDMNFDSGLTELDLDLSANKVRNLSIDAGLSDIFVKLGNMQKILTMDVKCGLTNVEIEVPEDSGIKILYEGLSLSDVEGFERTESGFYETANFDTSAKKIIIRMKGGLSNFEIDRY